MSLGQRPLSMEPSSDLSAFSGVTYRRWPKAIHDDLPTRCLRQHHGTSLITSRAWLNGPQPAVSRQGVGAKLPWRGSGNRAAPVLSQAGAPLSWRASDCERGRKRLTGASPSERSEQSQIARAAKTRAQQQDSYVIVVLELPEVPSSMSDARRWLRPSAGRAHAPNTMACSAESTPTAAAAVISPTLWPAATAAARRKPSQGSGRAAERGTTRPAATSSSCAAMGGVTRMVSRRPRGCRSGRDRCPPRCRPDSRSAKRVPVSQGARNPGVWHPTGRDDSREHARSRELPVRARGVTRRICQGDFVGFLQKAHAAGGEMRAEVVESRASPSWRRFVQQPARVSARCSAYAPRGSSGE